MFKILQHDIFICLKKTCEIKVNKNKSFNLNIMKIKFYLNKIQYFNQLN
jgi:hypothetical protein